MPKTAQADVPPSVALQRIEDALIESIMTASPEEIAEELREQGIDPDQALRDFDGMSEKAFAKVRERQVAERR